LVLELLDLFVPHESLISEEELGIQQLGCTFLLLLLLLLLLFDARFGNRPKTENRGFLILLRVYTLGVG
jgi:hypothetical protein